MRAKDHCALLAAVLLSALPCGAALAHAHVEAASPADNAVLAAAPEKLVLRFSEVVALPKLAPGSYVLRYVAVSDDTHEARGVLHFTVQGTGP